MGRLTSYTAYVGTIALLFAVWTLVAAPAGAMPTPTFTPTMTSTPTATSSPTPTPPVSNVDPNAEVILVRKSCVAGSVELPNCFEHLGNPTGQSVPDAEVAEYWINQIRIPTASTPLLVDIGPGSWVGMVVSCPDDVFALTPNGRNVLGHITFRGAGQGTTEIAGNNSEISNSLGTFVITGSCEEMAFQDMTIREMPGSEEIFGGPVIWENGGNSRWTNVELLSDSSRLWYDQCQPEDEQPEHYFFASKLTLNARSRDQEAFRVECGIFWFFGSEISVFGTAETRASAFPSLTSFAAIHITDSATSLQLFGSLVRSIQGAAGPSVISGGTVYGVKNESNAAFHMHGGNMRVSASGSTNAVAIDAGAMGHIHTPETAFVVESEMGTSTRLAGDPAHIMSPFLWGSGPTPPQSDIEDNKIVSIDGQDIFVETDCNASGNCAGAGNQPHLMIYSTGCVESPWFDVVTGACRQ